MAAAPQAGGDSDAVYVLKLLAVSTAGEPSPHDVLLFILGVHSLVGDERHLRAGSSPGPSWCIPRRQPPHGHRPHPPRPWLVQSWQRGSCNAAAAAVHAVGAGIKYGSLLTPLAFEPNPALALAVVLGTPIVYGAALLLRK